MVLGESTVSDSFGAAARILAKSIMNIAVDIGHNTLNYLRIGCLRLVSRQ